MRMLIQSIHIFTTDGKESVFNFSESLTFIYGNVGTGKSTMLNLIMYGLGNSLVYTPAVTNCLEAVQIDLLLDGKPFHFFRAANSNRIEIDDIARNRRMSVQQYQMSSFLYKQFSLPELYLSHGNIDGKKVKLSFANFCWFSYLKQNEMDNCFFYLDSDNIFRQTAAINTLLSFFESTTLIDPEESKRYRILKRRLRQYEEGQEIFKYIESIFNSNENFNEDDIYGAVAEIRQQVDITGVIQLDSDNLNRLLENQKKIDLLQIKKTFELKRSRYNKELCALRDDVKEIISSIQLDQSLSNPNVNELYTTFLDCLNNVGFQGITKYDTINMNPKTFIPVLTNPFENRAVTYENLGSGGKKTIFKICFALAIHRLQHMKPELNYLPSFLIIDTPMKNISEREDMEMYNKFYQFLFKLFSTELSDTQLLVVDKEKRDTNDYLFHDDVVLMRMTHDEWMNPPLFKNYKGL